MSQLLAVMLVAGCCLCGALGCAPTVNGGWLVLHQSVCAPTPTP